MQLGDLLSERSRLAVGEVSQIGLGLARALSAFHCQNLHVGEFGTGDVEVLSDQTVTFRDHLTVEAGDEAATGDEDATGVEAVPSYETVPSDEISARYEYRDVARLAALLLQLAKRGSLVGTKEYPALHEFLLSAIHHPMLAGDFAISLDQNFPSEPLKLKDGPLKLKYGKVHIKLTPSYWCWPLGLVALVSWGLVIGLWVGW